MGAVFCNKGIAIKGYSHGVAKLPNAISANDFCDFRL